MFSFRILLSKKVIISLAVVSIFSLVLTFFPLVGTLGFEYSVVTAFVSSFISIFISAEYVNLDLKTLYPHNRRYTDLITSCLFINFVILLFPLAIGLVSSVMKSDCYILEGLILFALIPVVTVFFTSSLGLLIGNIFPKRGFFVGSIIILLIIVYSLWIIYIDPPIFAYNHIFGFFPGPLYDQVITIDQNLVVFRLVTLSWSVFLLLILKLIHDYGFKHISVVTAILSILFGVILMITFIYSNELGLRHTRQFLIENYFTDSYQTENFIIYFFPGSKVSNNIDLIALDHEFRYAQLSEYLELKSDKKIISYIYPDENIRKKLIGAGDTTIANPIQREIHLIYDTFPNPLLKHELTHILSSEFGSSILKISPKIGLVEGLAVAADWDELEGYDPHHWSRSILNLDSTVSIKDILGWGFWAAPASTSYTLTGSFVRYLIDTYGINMFKQVYRSGDFDIYKIGLENLINDWEQFLSEFEISYEMLSIARRIYGRPSIFEETCPRKSSYLSALGVKEFEKQNFYQASIYFEKALTYNPDNNYILESLAYSYFQNGDYYNLKQLAKNRNDIPDISFNIIRNLVANVKWVKGDKNRAEKIFKDLSQVILPIDISNEVDIKVDALEYKNDIRKTIVDYYSTQDMLTRVAILENAIRKYPKYSVPYYLLGKIFFYRWDFERSLVYLKQSETLGLPSRNLEIDNDRLLGVSLFANGRYEEAVKIFKKIIKLKNGGRYYNISNDFLERINWIEKQLAVIK